MSRPRPSSLRLAGWLLGALCLVGYAVTARIVGERFPFSPLTMFSGTMDNSSRIVARTAAGELRELRRYVDWQCTGPLDFSKAPADEACASFHTENDQLAADWIAAHPAPADRAGGGEPGEAIDVVRRVFRVERAAGAPVTARDCLLARCRARPRR